MQKITLQQLESFLWETADILRGNMDVSSIFNKRDDQYYDFKTEIQTKEQIREFLNTEEQSVISQFERWWDKYKVSLNELDKEVKQSEEVMKNNLKELGYE